MQLESPKGWVINAALWEGDEYIIEIRPAYEKSWKAQPLGSTLSKKDAKLIEGWLRGALRTLLTIGANVGKEQSDALRAALEAAPKPTHHVDDYTDLWFVDEVAYALWYNGQRQVALEQGNG